VKRQKLKKGSFLVRAGWGWPGTEASSYFCNPEQTLKCGKAEVEDRLVSSQSQMGLAWN